MLIHYTNVSFFICIETSKKFIKYRLDNFAMGLIYAYTYISVMEELYRNGHEIYQIIILNQKVNDIFLNSFHVSEIAWAKLFVNSNRQNRTIGEVKQ